VDKTTLTSEEKNKIIFLINFYATPMSSCSGVEQEFINGYNYAISKLKEKINKI
jgi:hypothetical protein